MATPLGASPDEPAHILKAASVVRGQLVGEPTASAAVTNVDVPASLSDAVSWSCYRFDATAEASCMLPLRTGGGLEPASTSAGLYNPLYYAMVGWPSLLTENAKLLVFGMRAVSALITTFFLATAFWALARVHGGAILGVAFLAACTPMVFFLAGAVNPNAVEIASGASLFSLLLYVVRGSSGRPSWGVLAAIVGSALVFANSRGLAPLWMAAIAVLALAAASPGRILALLRQGRVIVTLVLLASTVLAAAGWIISTGTLSSMGVFPGAGEASPASAFVVMLFDRTFDPGIIGLFGWLDTYAPAFVYMIWSALILALLIVAFALVRGRDLVALILATLVVILVPPIVQAASVSTSGYIWQGRYTLVAYVCLMLLAGLLVAERAGTFSLDRRVRIALGVVVVVGHVYALVLTTKRYAVGLDASWGAFLLRPDWAPPGGAAVWTAFLAVGSAGLVVLALFGLPAAASAERRVGGSARTRLNVELQGADQQLGADHER